MVKGPYVYNKINGHLNIFESTIYSCKIKLDNYLKQLTYSETEALLTVIS